MPKTSTAQPPARSIGRRYASLSAAADYLGVNEKTIRRHIAVGRITGYRLGNRLIRIDLNELDQVMRPLPSAGGGDAA
jgi:excisionase family DNA binding protein